MNWVLGILAVAVGFMVWTKFVYEPKRDAKVAADTRLFEVLMAHQLIEAAGTPAGREEMLATILARRPGMAAWPEFRDVFRDAGAE